MTKHKKQTVKKIKRKGFTLVELLISVGLFSVVSAIIVAILFTSLRASKKSEVIVGVKQSGNTALAQIIRGVRFARSLDNPVSCLTTVTQSSIRVTGGDNGQTTYSCPAGASTSISSNSAALVDTTSVIVSACSFTCSQATINDPPTIKIQFVLTAANQTSTTESRGSVPFETSITLRNFSR